MWLEDTRNFRLNGKAVTDTVDGLNQVGAGACFFKFSAQVFDVGVYGSAVCRYFDFNSRVTYLSPIIFLCGEGAE
jgi:hypothetical protein